MSLRNGMIGIAGWIVIAAYAGAADVQVPGWKPDKPVEIIAPSAPGGGTDKTARLIQRIWQDKRLLDVPINVVNRPGGGGAVSLTYLKQHAGDAHYVHIASAVILTNHIIGRSAFSHADFTPVALLNSEYVALAVKADSPLQTVRDLMTRLRSDPAAVSVAVGTSAGGVNHATAARVARAAGSDPRKLRVVVFKSSSESMAAMLGGHVDVTASSASILLSQVRSGALRMLAVAAPRRLGGALAQVPTLKEQGVDAVVDNFRVMIAAPAVPAEAVAYWDGIMGRLAQDGDWRKDLDSNQWENSYMNSRDTRRYLEEQHGELKAVLSEAGLVK